MTTTEATAAPAADPIEALLYEGRRKLVTRRAMAAREECARRAADEAAFERSIAPLTDALMRLLPECWRPYVDPREGEFAPAATAHRVTVALPGLAPITVRLAVEEWSDPVHSVGIWRLTPDPFRVPSYYAELGDDGYFVAESKDGASTADPAEAVALAAEAAAEREKFAAACVDRNTERAQTLADRAAAERLRPRPTPGEALLAALRGFVLAELPAVEGD